MQTRSSIDKFYAFSGALLGFVLLAVLIDIVLGSLGIDIHWNP